MKGNSKAIALALATILFWSTMASAFNLALRSLNFGSLLLWTSLFSLLAIVGVVTVQRKWSLLKAQPLREWVHSLLMGLMNPFLYYFILFRAYEILPAQEAMVLNYTWPVMLVLLSVPLLKQKISRLSLLAVLVSFMGIVLIGTKGQILTMRFTNALGDGLAMGSSIIWALFWIYNVRSKIDPVVKLFMNFLPGAAFVLMGMGIVGIPLQFPDLAGWLTSAYIGFFEMGLTFVMWLTALKLARNTQSISQWVFLSPFLSLVWISLIVGETIHPSTIIGLVLIIAGIGLAQLKKASIAQ